MELLALAAVIGLLPASIAHRKGRNFFVWWAFGALLWIIALPASLLIKRQPDRVCSFCAEEIKLAASVCPHCRHELTEVTA